MHTSLLKDFRPSTAHCTQGPTGNATSSREPQTRELTGYIMKLGNGANPRPPTGDLRTTTTTYGSDLEAGTPEQQSVCHHVIRWVPPHLSVSPPAVTIVPISIITPFRQGCTGLCVEAREYFYSSSLPCGSSTNQLTLVWGEHQSAAAATNQ